ncbi:UvrD-helicase domain-containing protein [Sulfuritalea sp.]|uniref:UvrD-helicase domain-containing protein n=1 Tax=Sulfuritalea sp. TaxID=2480090 RepID=UPI001ACE2E1E|nr:UvrD-helicase domain-containing protein [Sulfuritalea sp.]MBN8476285.1 UvrD-helicase domain-containing protein [Sulfuritalea sp.]
MFKLNPAQLEAVRHLDSPLLVLAGAGSGKTRVITQKIAWLVEDYGVKPGQIAAITFTNKAAKEMKERVGKLIGGRAEGLIVSTFHALGVRILRQEAGKLGLKPGFSILDAADTAALYQELAGNVDKLRLRALQSRVSLWKNQLVEPEAALAEAADDIESTAATLYAAYDRTLRAYQAVDFDDLIRLPVKLFGEHDEVAERWRSRLWHVLVDEYQDTNRGQYRLLRLLTRGRDSFTAVGDDDQSIYAWRGADSENLRLLKEDYPGLKVVKLEQNYRSTARILHAANTLIANNPKLFEKKLWSEHGQGEAIHVQNCRDGEHEAEWVVSRLSAHRFERRTNFSDYAILYRGNHQARAIEQQLRAQRIPYVISGGQSFFDRAEVKDITSYLRLLSNQDDDPAFIRAVTTPKRGIGGTTLEALGRAAGRRHQSLFAAIYAPGLDADLNVKQRAALREFGDFIKRMEARAAKEAAGAVLNDLVRAIGYESWLFESLEPREAESRWANVSDLVAWLEKKGVEESRNLLELAQSVALLSMLDQNDGEQDAVQLATLHAAKGLEFRHVFLVGVEEGLLPHRDSLEPGKLEEERRLMYVGITRAQASLTVSHCEKRKQGRELMLREPSRFIVEMGAEVASAVQQRNTVPEPDAARARASALRAMLAGKR